MKKLLLFTLAAAFALSLTGCKKDTENEPSAPINHDRDFSLVSRIEDFPNEIPLPDGTTVPKSALVTYKDENGYPMEGELALEFAFIRYAEPIFECTLDDPGIIDLNTFEPRGDIPRELKSPEWIKVQAGDVLENGLKVVSAQTPCGYRKYQDGSAAVILDAGKLKLEGEITYEGIFKYFNGSKAYGSGDYYLEFYPDSTKYMIPVTYEGDPTEPRSINTKTANLGCNQALVYDGANFQYFRFENDFKDLLKEDTVGKAKMTFKDIVVFGSGFLDGKIIDAELEF